MRHHYKIFVLSIIVCWLLVVVATAGVPRVISYQGRATDASGNLVPDGTYPVKFLIWDHPTVGSLRWSEEGVNVTTTGGLFNCMMGGVNPIPDSLFAKYDSLYLQVNFNNETLLPRTSLVSTGYAFRVNSVDGASGGTITGDAVFTGGVVKIGDSTMLADDNGIRIGDSISPSSSYLIRATRSYSTSAARFGYYSDLHNSLGGILYGAYYAVGDTIGDGRGLRYGVYASVANDPTSTASQYGIYGSAGRSSKSSGASYGVYGAAASGPGASAFAIYGLKIGTGAGYAGYFAGNVDIGGTLTKNAGAFKIDHPLDPGNKYLQHSFVESPDMKNIYDGITVTDTKGMAVVTLPAYFEALNMDFRYQLTVIGQFAQAIVAAKITSNRFVIRTDSPNVEVSWQVTGIRRDAYAREHRLQVEIDKPVVERGTYRSPEEHGQPIEKSVNWEQIKAAQERESERDVQQ